MDKTRYAKAIQKLLITAREDSAGARVAAQVMLSAYNGSDYQLNVTELGVLDQDHYQAALNVIRGRTELNTAPHTIIENGDRIFMDLWEKWQRYHVSNRWKPTCYSCYGSGMIPAYPDDDCNHEQMTCNKCEGKGY